MNYKLLSLFFMLMNVALMAILVTHNITEYSWNSTSMFNQETPLYKFRNIFADILLQSLGIVIYIIPITLLIWSYKFYIGIKVKKIYFRILTLIYVLVSYPACTYFLYPYDAGIVGMYISYHLPFIENLYYIIFISDIIALLFTLSITVSGYMMLGKLIILIITKPYYSIKKAYYTIKHKKNNLDYSQENIEINILPKTPQSIKDDHIYFDKQEHKIPDFSSNINFENSSKPEVPQASNNFDDTFIPKTNIKEITHNNINKDEFFQKSSFFQHLHKKQEIQDTNKANGYTNEEKTVNSSNNSNEDTNSNYEDNDHANNTNYSKTQNIVSSDNEINYSNENQFENKLDDTEAFYDTPKKTENKTPYHIPTSLISDIQTSKTNISRNEIQANSKKLEQTMKEFGILGKVVNIKTGPVVTLYEITIPAGVKTSKLISLETDIALRMKAISVRIAVVPGKDVIGIEIPNKQRKTVYFKEILTSKEFQNNAMKLPLILGHNTNGHPVVADLALMPHLLIAGTTGSGKSVGINVMILSLLYKYSPDKCKLIMIDPKMLELSVYQDIPHLLTPVVTDSKQAIIALKWAVKEMEQRYYKMSLLGVRNVIGYNDKIKNTQDITAKQRYLQHTQGINLLFEYMPYIVVIIDEMADLMMVAGKEVEAAVQRLAQMARAAGIHVIMATQRPSADVITGTIKANFPTRIAFQVSSKIDSRIVLESQGAEQLLGKGDMLFMPGVGRLQRVHAPFVSDDEVYTISSYLKETGTPDYIESITAEPEIDGGTQDLDNEIDELYNQAIDIIIKEGKVSTSFLQRKFQIGYNRAARIVEHLEENNIISKASPTGKREILINR